MSVHAETLLALQPESSPLAGTQMQLSIRDLFSELVIRQRYVNSETTPIEAIFTFPMAMDATLLELSARIGGRTLTGTIAPRAEARENYEEAIAKGDSGVLLERQSADLYTASLGNVNPGESVELALRFGQLLRPCAHRLRIRIPTTVAPRYGRSPLEPQDEPQSSLTIEHRLSFEARIEGVLARTAISCPTHPAQVRTDEEILTLSVSDEHAFLDRDLVLGFEGISLPPLLAYGAESGDSTMLLAALNIPAASSAPRRALSIAILLDCSGSMGGDSIRLARQGLAAALGSLEQGRDRFTILRFGSRVEPMFPKVVPFTYINLKHAERALALIAADLGGTELGAALDVALDALSREDGERVVFLLSDGESHEARESHVLARARELGVRIYAVGVGAAPVEAVLRPLAERSGGSVEFVTPGESMSARVERHFTRMGAAAAGDIELSIPRERSWTFAPGTAAEGETVWVASEISGASPTAVELRVDGVAFQTELTTIPAGTEIARLAAALRLTEPAAEGFDEVEFAVRHRLLTTRTACVLVAPREGDSVPEMPATRIVPHMLAAGWGGTGRVVADSSVNFCLAFDEMSTSDHAIDAGAADELSIDLDLSVTPQALVDAWAELTMTFHGEPEGRDAIAAFVEAGEALSCKEALEAWLRMILDLGLLKTARWYRGRQRNALRAIAESTHANPKLVALFAVSMPDRGLHARLLERLLVTWRG